MYVDISSCSHPGHHRRQCRQHHLAQQAVNVNQLMYVGTATGRSMYVGLDNDRAAKCKNVIFRVPTVPDRSKRQAAGAAAKGSR